MTKVLYSPCYGGFGVSQTLINYIFDKYGIEINSYSIKPFERHDPRLIESVLEVGLEESSDIYAKLQIYDLDDDEKYYIDEYDGYESVITEDSIKWVHVL